jgi:serine/threonine-protein kinase
MADAPSDPRIGLVLQSRYRIEERLGSGGMGVVYLAERIGLGRRVAIKFLHPDIAAQPQFRVRFEREARAMSKLHHPHCVPVIDFGVADAPYIVLEYVVGESLSHLLARGPIPLRRALIIMRQILAGLAHAHNEGIVHRDIKPDNVLLAEATGTGDHARLLDFGLAKVTKRAGTASGLLGATAMGTPSYMSPEQARGEDVDARSDLYSCGVMLFQMLTGKRPFTGSDPLDVLRAHVEDRPPRLVDAAPDMRFPAQLETVLAGALSKNPDGRYASAIDFSEALRAIQDLPGVDESNALIEATKPRRDEEREKPFSEHRLPTPPPAAVAIAGPPLTQDSDDVAYARPRKKGWGFGDYLFWFLVLLVLAVAGGGAWYLQRDLEKFEAPPPAAKPR